jgi:hypothetical protein
MWSDGYMWSDAVADDDPLVGLSSQGMTTLNDD